MTSSLKDKILIIILIIIFLGLFLGGLFVGRKSCPIVEVQTDTVYVYNTEWQYIRDTIIYPITNNIIIVDTLFVPQIVYKGLDPDIAITVRDYNTVYNYHWEKRDSAINFRLTTTITKNRPIDYNFSYQILSPQTIITNKYYTEYNRYLSTGAFLALSDNNYIFGPKVLYVDKNVSTGLEIGLNKKFVSISIGKTFKIGK